LATERTALVVVHGVDDQLPGSTATSIVPGPLDYLLGSPYTVSGSSRSGSGDGVT